MDSCQIGDDLTTNKDGEVQLTVESSAHFIIRFIDIYVVANVQIQLMYTLAS